MGLREKLERLLFARAEKLYSDEGLYGAREAGRDLERHSPDERAEAEAWYKLTEEHALSLVAPSKLCWPIALEYVTLGMGVEPDSPNGSFCLMAVNMGYAARIADIERRSDLTPWSERDIADLLGFEHGRLDAIKAEGFYPRFSQEIIEWMQSAFADPYAILVVASCTRGVWEGFLSWSVLNIHGNMQKNSARPGDLEPSDIDALMRTGYLLRCLDEALGEEPGDLTAYSV